MSLMAPMHRAAGCGNLYQVAMLLADQPHLLDFQDGEGWTPLMEAVNQRRGHVASYLLDHGADSNLSDRVGTTPLHRAAMHGFEDMVDLLLTHGKANARRCNLRGETPVMMAAAGGRLEALKSLLWSACGGGMKIMDARELVRGRTAVYMACAEGHVDAAKLLLQCGADTAIPDCYGVTPEGVARAQGREACRRLVQDAERLYVVYRVRSMYDDTAELRNKSPSSRHVPSYLAGRGKAGLAWPTFHAHADMDADTDTLDVRNTKSGRELLLEGEGEGDGERVKLPGLVLAYVVLVLPTDLFRELCAMMNM